MTWILSLGFVPNSSLKISGNSAEDSSYLTQTFETGFYLADLLHIYSAVEIRETKNTNDIYFDPFRGDFLIGGSFYFKNFSIGILHECNHDIITGANLHDYNGWEAAFDKVYITYAMPIRVNSQMAITPSIALTDQFTEKVRKKNNDEKNYFGYTAVYSSPNILFPELRLEMEFFHLRCYIASLAGYAVHNSIRAYTQFELGAEIFYKNISLGVDYIKRVNRQKNAGYSLEELILFIRFRGKSALL
jgi:hypothetical protein